MTARTDLAALRGIEALFDVDAPLFLEQPLSFNLRHNYARVQSVLARRDVQQRIGGMDTRCRFSTTPT